MGRCQIDDDRGVLRATLGVRSRVLVDADDTDSLEPARVLDHQPAPGGQHGVVGGVPGDSETGGHVSDREPVDDHRAQRPQGSLARGLRPGFSRGPGALPPHGVAARAPVAADAQLQHRGPPPQWDESELAGDRAPRDALLVALAVPRVELIEGSEPAFQDGQIGLDPLADGSESGLVQAAERVEIGVGEGSLVHIEVFRMGSVRISIIERPRPLPGHRHADRQRRGRYTLICEEPVNCSAGDRQATDGCRLRLTLAGRAPPTRTFGRVR